MKRSKDAENELHNAQERFASEKGILDRQLRTSNDANRTLEEELEDLRSEQSSGDRKLRHDLEELQGNYKRLEQTLHDTQRDRDEKTTTLSTTNQRLSQREKEVGDLESEVLRLKTLAGDVEVLEGIKRELSQQVEHIQKLEATNLDQRIELKQLRKKQKSVEVVEEEKRVLESKLRIMHDLRKELSEAQLQKQILDDERRSWTSYLANESSVDGQPFETPEALAMAYISSCAENAELVDKLGKVSPDLAAKDQLIQSIEDDRTRLSEDLNKLRTTGGGASDLKARTRVERQRALAVKEVEYLRSQLKTFDDEQAEFNAEQYDQQKTDQIQHLQDMLDQHRKELQKLHDNLTESEASPAASGQSLKRPRESGEDERLGELSRKNRKLQDEFSHLTTTRDLLQKELDATKSQLKAAKSSQTRILELRDNPTAKYHAVRSSMLETLRSENEGLLTRLEANGSGPTTRKGSSDTALEHYAPKASLDRLRLELEESKAALISFEKKTDRLKKVWAQKSREWRQTVAQTLGWDFEFQPNGRVRVTSNFNAGISEDEGGDGSNSIIFDGEKGTMKCSGGPRSTFAASIDDEIRYWVDDKKEVSCFLATLTLKFWDDTTKAQRVI